MGPYIQLKGENCVVAQKVTTHQKVYAAMVSSAPIGMGNRAADPKTTTHHGKFAVAGLYITSLMAQNVAVHKTTTPHGNYAVTVLLLNTICTYSTRMIPIQYVVNVYQFRAWTF